MPKQKKPPGTEATQGTMVDRRHDTPVPDPALDSIEKAAHVIKKHKDNTKAERLVEVALAAWETHGYAGISARLIAQQAGQPVSSIYYHFSDLERLLLSSQACALDAARRWCARQLDVTPAILTPAADAIPPLLTALIQNWSIDHRHLAFAWRECQLAAARNDNYLPVLREWDAMWTSFWDEISARSEIPELARLTHHLFDGESFLHLIRGQPIADLACLSEICRGWGDWLRGAPALEGPWRRHARTEAARAVAIETTIAPVAERIAAAAADLVTREGAAALTHRAAALEAGLTLGAISYHYRTRDELLQVAFETIYQRVMRMHIGDAAPRTGTAYADYRREIFAFEDSPDVIASRLALNELLVAVARDETFKDVAAQLRYLRGRASRSFLVALLGEGTPDSALEAALCSDIIFGMRRGQIGQDAIAARTTREQDLTQLESLLKSTRST
jgi:AcrR family transcriptional regulator